MNFKDCHTHLEQASKLHFKTDQMFVKLSIILSLVLYVK